MWQCVWHDTVCRHAPIDNFYEEQVAFFRLLLLSLLSKIHILRPVRKQTDEMESLTDSILIDFFLDFEELLFIICVLWLEYKVYKSY